MLLEHRAILHAVPIRTLFSALQVDDAGRALEAWFDGGALALLMSAVGCVATAASASASATDSAGTRCCSPAAAAFILQTILMAACRFGAINTAATLLSHGGLVHAFHSARRACRPEDTPSSLWETTDNPPDHAIFWPFDGALPVAMQFIELFRLHGAHCLCWSTRMSLPIGS